jgi:hypothetical protein
MAKYTGVVVFRDGVHYGVDKNGDPDLDRPLRWADDGGYRDAEEGEPLHNDVHHAVEAELPVGGEN